MSRLTKKKILELLKTHKVNLQYVGDDYDSYIFIESLIREDKNCKLTPKEFEMIKEWLNDK